MKYMSKNMIGLLIASTMSSVVLSQGAFAGERLSQEHLTGLLSSEERSQKDSERDEARKPADIMYFSEVSAGDQVIDLFAGGGWYSELFSMAVGESGKVYAQNDNVIWQFAEKGITERTKDNRLENITRLDKVEIADMPIANNSVDLVFTALNYHDLFFTHSNRGGKITQFREKAVDHKAALAKIKNVLKDDGIFVIVDHVGVQVQVLTQLMMCTE